MAPTLTSDRLTLRPWTLDDVEADLAAYGHGRGPVVEPGHGRRRRPAEHAAAAPALEQLTVRDVAVSRRSYADIFGGQIVLEENPATVQVANSWIIMNPGGGPTPDKPDVKLAPPEAGDADPPANAGQ